MRIIGRWHLSWLWQQPALASALIAIAALAAYANSFQVPLLFDDISGISNNVSIRRLWPLGPVLSPPAAVVTGGRPVANLSFALNYAADGTKVVGYHIGNFALHLWAALTLFAVLRRTLVPLPLSSPLRREVGAVTDAALLAFVAARDDLARIRAVMAPRPP